MRTPSPSSGNPLPTEPPPTLEDRVLKFIEGHNPHIWTVIACVTAVVVYTR